MISICLVLSWKPRFLAIKIVIWLSQFIGINIGVMMPKSCTKECSHTLTWGVGAIARYSVISVKTRLLNAHFYVSNKIYNSTLQIWFLNENSGKSRSNPQRGRLRDWNQKIIFGIFRFRKRKWMVKGRKWARRWNESNKCFQTPCEDWKTLIDGGNVVFRVCKCENVDEQMRKMEEMDRNRS